MVPRLALLACCLVNVAWSERTQTLTLRQQPACATVGGETHVFVDYGTSDAASATAVSFRVDYNTTNLKEVAKSSATAAGCQFAGLVDGAGYVGYTCASLLGQKILPAKAPGLVRLTFRVLAAGAQGSTLRLSPNRALAGQGYRYADELPALQLNMCGAGGEPAPTATPAVDGALVLRPSPVEASGQVQVLSLEAKAKSCLQKGDVATVRVAYRAADDARTSALAFALEFDPAIFTATNAVRVPNTACQLSAFSTATPGKVEYSCASFAGATVVPAYVDDLVVVELQATGASGSSAVRVVPNNVLVGTGYQYKTGAPIDLVARASCATCTPGPWKPWQPCSRTCGGGTRQRQRAHPAGYDGASFDRSACAEVHFEESASCSPEACLGEAATYAANSKGWTACSHVTCRYEWMPDLNEFSTVVQRHWGEKNGQHFHCEHDGSACGCLCQTHGVSEVHHYDASKAADANGKQTWRVAMDQLAPALQPPSEPLPTSSVCNCFALAGKAAYASFCNSIDSPLTCGAASDACGWSCPSETSSCACSARSTDADMEGMCAALTSEAPCGRLSLLCSWACQHKQPSVMRSDVKVTAKVQVQVLEMAATSKACVQAGDTTAVSVDYRAADDQKTSALSFKVVFDPKYFSLQSRHRGTDDPDCELNGFTSDTSFVSYTCASTGDDVVAPTVSGVVSLVLEATGATGATAISLVPNTYLAGDGYTYKAAKPIVLRSGGACFD